MESLFYESFYVIVLSTHKQLESCPVSETWERVRKMNRTRAGESRLFFKENMKYEGWWRRGTTGQGETKENKGSVVKIIWVKGEEDLSEG